ncbi:MAG: hypothetical protein FWC77_01710 [Defluviitaleaceae bacterium]|nr:hypothetical protein [Defluviitaleaceae bacterium]
MKKIINGKRYDTATAKDLGEKDYYNNGNWFYTETLFQKITGEFFLFTSSDERNIYAPENGIKPLGLSAAQTWAEEHLDGDEYEAIFGEVDDSKVQVAFWVSVSDKVRADAIKATQAEIFLAGIKALEA